MRNTVLKVLNSWGGGANSTLEFLASNNLKNNPMISSLKYNGPIGISIENKDIDK